MRVCEGTVRVRLHPTKGVTLAPGTEGSTLTAEDAAKILTIMVEGAMAAKCGIDRWSLYIPEAKVSKEAKQLPIAEVAKALKAGFKPRLRTGRFNQPCIVLGSEQDAAPKRKSNIIDLA